MNHIHITAKLGALDLQVDANFPDAFIIVSGENGAGKTTLLRCVSGLEQAQGQVMIGDQIWLDNHAGFTLSATIRQPGCVWSDPALLPWLSVEQNILLGTQQLDKPWLAKLVGKLEITTLLQRKPKMLSSGEAQRVALARAIYRKPAALLLDEPFSAQAPAIRKRLRKTLKRIQAEQQIPIIMVSHDAEDARVLAHQHWHMREGKLILSANRHSPKEGNPEQSTKVANNE